MSSLSTMNGFYYYGLFLELVYSVAQTPSGRLLRRSSHPEDGPALFAAHFALSHACWLISYPLAGWLGDAIGLSNTACLLSVFAVGGCLFTYKVWPAYNDEGSLTHSHEKLLPEDPHWQQGHCVAGNIHTHDFIIDKLHRHWPKQYKI